MKLSHDNSCVLSRSHCVLSRLPCQKATSPVNPSVNRVHKFNASSMQVQLRVYRRMLVDSLVVISHGFVSPRSLNNLCIKCQIHVRMPARKYWERDREKLLAYNKAYRQSHKEQFREYERKYAAAHKEQIAEANAQYYQNHKEQFREYCKTYREQNKELIAEKASKRYYKNKHGITIKHEPKILTFS